MVKETTLTEAEKIDMKADMEAPTGLFDMTGSFKILYENSK